jgi:iron complex transport system ATP-binding protein
MTDPALRVSGLSFSYSGKPLLSGVDFELDAGKILAILGPNGSGKTTLLNCVAGILRPGAGNVKIFGEDIKAARAADIAKRICFVPQIQDSAFDFTVRDYIVMGRAPHIPLGASPEPEDYRRAGEAASAAGVDCLADSPFNRISGGERQLVQIGRALAQGAPVILMDEPTNHLDYGNQMRVLRLISSLARDGYTVVMSSHAPDHAIMLDSYAGVIRAGGVFEMGSAREILSGELLSELYGTRIALSRVEPGDRIVCVPERP